VCETFGVHCSRIKCGFFGGGEYYYEGEESNARGRSGKSLVQKIRQFLQIKQLILEVEQSNRHIEESIFMTYGNI